MKIGELVHEEKMKTGEKVHENRRAGTLQNEVFGLNRKAEEFLYIIEKYLENGE